MSIVARFLTAREFQNLQKARAERPSADGLQVRIRTASDELEGGTLLADKTLASASGFLRASPE
jgi:hypothetical protein